jgi:hypothetical protein
MRVVIRVGHEDKFYSLVCINEDSKGVYVVMYGAASGMHFSYHADGKKWFKKANGEIFQELGSSTPIDEISFVQGIQSQSGVISTDALQRMGTVYQKEDPESSSAIFLNSDILGDNLMVHSYILNREKEPDFAKFLQKEEYAKGFRILACNIFALDNFPNHKVALVILGRN